MGDKSKRKRNSLRCYTTVLWQLTPRGIFFFFFFGGGGEKQEQASYLAGLSGWLIVIFVMKYTFQISNSWNEKKKESIGFIIYNY